MTGATSSSMALAFEPHLSSLTGQVVRGRRRGHGLGFPTANLDAPVPHTLRHGMYSAWVHASDGRHRGVLCVGPGGTFATSGLPQAEVHLLDVRCHLYGQTLTVHPVDYLGPSPRATEDLELARQLRRAGDTVRRRLPQP